MKAQLIISQNEFNTKRVFDQLIGLLKNSSKHYSDHTRLFKDFTNDDVFMDANLDETKVQAFLNIPSEKLYKLTFNGSFRLIFSDADNLDKAYNGDYNKYDVFYISKFNAGYQADKLAKYLFYTVNIAFVLSNNWTDQAKDSTLEFLELKRQKAYADFIEVTTVNKKQLVNG